MLNLRKLLLVLLAAIVPTSWAAQPESNPIRTRSASVAETGRLIVGFQPNSTTGRAQTMSVSQIQAATQQVSLLAKRVGLNLAHSRQIAPNMHVMHLQYTLRGAEIDAALARLRADPMVKFAVVDQRRFPHTIPNDSLFGPTTTATGQWYMQTPVPTGDASAVDAISAWSITTGSKGIVIADVDSGIRFDHPDLGRVGSGGRLLPGFDFVGEDYNPTTSAPLNTFLAANDGDGWDPDPSDPGDWISAPDLKTTLFANCGDPTTGGPTNSEWHGTRVTGILGAISNNNIGIAGMTWQAWMLPVRALGKCGGYDSDIIAAMQWAAGISVPGVPDNPYPANIINMSIGGGSDACNQSAYPSVIASIISRGVLIVASAGNASGPVETPGNCSGVLAVAGLRNIGTKVGYSSFGPEVGISAPAGNCINSSGACLRSIDTTFNLGATTPTTSGYTDQTNSNLGTSFSAPIVSGIAALMRSVNANLTPPQLIARIQEGALPFPTNPAVLTCPNIADPNSGECNCVAGQCGAGMANALGAVNAALRPIAAIALPTTVTVGSNAIFDATGSTAACNHSIVSYVWTVTTGNPAAIVSGASSSKVTVIPQSSSITLHLVVTDDQNRTDSADVTVNSNSSSSLAPTVAGTTACPTVVSVMPSNPTVGAAFAPSSIGVNGISTLTLTLSNANAFELTSAALTDQLPTGVIIASPPNAATTCINAMVSTTTAGISLVPLNTAIQAGVQIPVQSSCLLHVSVTSATAGSYPNTIASGAFATGPAGSNTAAVSATLTVTAPAPTVAISVAPTSITLGSSSTLTWSSTNVTSCSGSNGWNGTELTNGSVSETPTAIGTSTYTLTCTGAGGTAIATASLTVNTATGSTNSGGSHGGGILDPFTLFGYALILTVRRRYSQSARHYSSSSCTSLFKY